MRLILIRHGDAHAGFHGPIAGPKGCGGLTDLGRRQAGALRDHLAGTSRVQADLLITSVLPRAIETAEIVAPGLGLEVAAHDCDLCEVHTGEADGMDWAAFTERYGTFDMEAEPDRVFAEGGDSWNSFHRRVGDLLDRLARDHPGETVVAVCHAGVIMASMRLLLGIGDPATSAHLRPSNTGLTEWEHVPELGGWILRSYNETEHLLALPPPPRPDDEPVILLADADASDDVGADDFSVEAARAASEKGDLGRWLAEFLASPGSDNAPLADQLLRDYPIWTGPIEVPLDQLNRLAGAPGTPALEVVEEHEWRDDVKDLADKVDDGHVPPPVIATYQDGKLVLEDGNHRVEAIRQAGEPMAWTLIGFVTQHDHDSFRSEVALTAR